MVSHKTIAAICLVALLTLAQSGNARADITQIQKISFGRWAITNNNSQHFITVSTNGSYSSSPSLIMRSPPQPGIYQIDGLPPFTAIGSVTVTVNQQMHGAGPDFTVDNFTTNVPATNVGGNTVLTLGATARTSGGGTGYPDATYNGELHIEINL